MAAILLGVVVIGVQIWYYSAPKSGAMAPAVDTGVAPNEKPFAILAVLFLFYVLTMVATGLFIWRLIRPASPRWWSYVAASVGGGVGLWLNHMLDSLPHDPSVQTRYAPAWSVATPNLVLLILVMLIDGYLWWKKKEA